MGNFLTKTLRQYVPQLRTKTLGFHAEPFDMKHYESIFAVMTEGQNVFSTGAKAVDFNINQASTFTSNAFDNTNIGWRMEDGIAGMGNFSYDSSWWAKPNIEQFHSRKLAENMGWLGDKLSGKGYLHDQVQWKLGYLGEKVGEFVDFVKNPADKILRDGESRQSSVTTTTTRKRFRSVGTLKGKTPYLHLNVTAKGMGRKSLRIGEEGMGDTKSGKYKTYRSGRRTSTSKATY